jgi:hypothetical protein
VEAALEVVQPREEIIGPSGDGELVATGLVEGKLHGPAVVVDVVHGDLGPRIRSVPPPS